MNVANGVEIPVLLFPILGFWFDRMEPRSKICFVTFEAFQSLWSPKTVRFIINRVFTLWDILSILSLAFATNDIKRVIIVSLKIFLSKNLWIFRVNKTKNIVIQDNDVGNLHLTFGAQSLSYNYLLLNWFLQNNTGTKDEVSSNKSVDDTNKSKIEIEIMLQTYKKKSFPNNWVES